MRKWDPVFKMQQQHLLWQQQQQQQSLLWQQQHQHLL